MLCNKWQRIAFVDDAFPLVKSSSLWPIVAHTTALQRAIGPTDEVIVAIGNQALRQKFYQDLVVLGASLATVIHPSACISPTAVVGPGVAIMAGAIVGTNAAVGRGAIVNANTTVDHDAVLGEFAHLGVGVQLAGGVIIGDRAWLQAGSCAGYKVNVLPDAIVAPGTVLIDKG
ncbi:UDP-N-acetylbacillosamine N-acetyltransferase [Eoetvoesiella caeni]